MSREAWEQSERNWWDSELPKGAGDPDWYGYPGQPADEEPSGEPIPDEPF